MPRKTALLGWKSFVFLFALALALGGMYRFADLGKKPMHTDEAILALKTQEFWRTGFFKYDPKDYHGPFLHEATRAMGVVRGMDADEMNERRFRAVVAIFGFAMILLPLFFLDVLGKTGTAMAAILLAVSPMMNFYSRYYIMEVPMVFLGGLMLGALWSWTKWRNVWWLLLAGACMGAMHATKETFVFPMAAIFAGVVAVKMMGGTFEAKSTRLTFSPKRGGGRVTWRSWFWLGFSATVVSVWQFSNGFREWTGVLESATTYLSYLQRSEGSGHEKPWTYYLGVLFWHKDGFLWTELMTGVLALMGILSVFFQPKLAKNLHAAQVFLAVYTVVLLALYSLIPYKTPWTILGVNFALPLLAGLGVRWVFVSTGPWILKALWLLILTGGVYHLCQQTSMATDYKFPGEVRYSADSRNPYVYSHTTTNFLKLVDLVEDLKEHHPDGNDMAVYVVQREFGWPLAWYLRDMPRVSYVDQFPVKLDAPVVVVDLDQEGKAWEILSSTAEAGPVPDYVTSVFGLRPGTNLAVLVREDLWNKREAKREAIRPGRRD
ncbi:TIGR03663 family protein [Phragmitibacter flavus]|uniref:TIGR03663 family protein n=1 Tax=Phragmitibacter flavus TaxID=2576071 RepID=A0A5R8KF82_9BACT|nr:flippase activity-associated protein Agl23 [Phragmitibacter flavus]TLD70943.1 TIGR03663 family protein [Phragmitibacter flavus]